MFDKSLITENRLASAKKKDMTPLRIFPDDQSALFSGSSGDIYETNLDECSCADFAIQGHAQPCKHMLRLAMEMNMIPSDGMQSDIESARAKYYLGRAKDFIHDADLSEVIRFAKDYLPMLYSGTSPADNAFADSIGLETLSDFPCFKISKRGTAKVEKGWAKDCEGLASILRNRFGNEVVLRLFDDEFISSFCKGE